MYGANDASFIPLPISRLFYHIILTYESLNLDGTAVAMSNDARRRWTMEEELESR
jgi:hypothetical protein